jgi:hypothetical protein
MKRYLWVACVALAPLTSACGGGGNHYYDNGYGGYDDTCAGYESPTNVLRVDIDTDQPADEPLQTDPGQGVGLLVDYVAGGTWRIAATCDTAVSNQSCDWLMVASIDPSLSLAVMDDGNLEKEDSITRVDKGAVRMHFTNDLDLDSATLTAPAGETLKISVQLDGCYNPSFVNWTSSGDVKTGAPSDPVEFVPVSP